MGGLAPNTSGLFAVAAAAALWAAGAAVASNLFDRGIAPLELVEARAIIAAIGLGLLTAAGRRKPPRRREASAVEDTSSRRRRAGAGRLVALGLALALVNLAYYLAIDRLDVAVAIVLQYSAPAMVVLWTSAVTRRRPPARVLIALAGALGGVILVSEVLAGDLGQLDLFGIVMGFSSAVLFATYTLLSESAQATYGPIATVFRAFAVASLFWIGVQIPRGWPSELFDPSNLGPVLFVGVAGTLVPFFLYVWGVGRVRSERASIAATLEPVLAAIFAWVWLGQSLSTMQIGGGILVIVSVSSLQAARGSRMVDKRELSPEPPPRGRPAARL